MRTKRRKAGGAVAHEAEGNRAAPAQHTLWAVPLRLAGGEACAQTKWLGLAHCPVNSSIAGFWSSNMASAHLLEQPRSRPIVESTGNLLAWPQPSRQWCASKRHPDLSAFHASWCKAIKGRGRQLKPMPGAHDVIAASARLRPRRANSVTEELSSLLPRKGAGTTTASVIVQHSAVHTLSPDNRLGGHHTTMRTPTRRTTWCKMDGFQVFLAW